MSWQPIETAPKDGTPVLLYGGAPGYGSDLEYHPVAVIVGWYLPGGWQYAWFDGGYYGAWEQPTHWMPLPEAPRRD